MRGAADPAERSGSWQLLLVGALLLFVSSFSCVGLPLLVSAAGGDEVIPDPEDFEPELDPGDDGLWPVERGGVYKVLIVASGTDAQGEPGRAPGEDRWPFAAFAFRAATGDRVPLKPSDEQRKLPWMVGSAHLEPGRYEVLTPDLGEGFRVDVLADFAVGIAREGGGESAGWGGILRWLFGLVTGIGGLVAVGVGVGRSRRRG